MAKKKRRKRPSGAKKQSTSDGLMKRRRQKQVWAVFVALAMVVALPGFALMFGAGDDEVPDRSRPPEVSGEALPRYTPGATDPALGMLAPEVSGTDFDGTEVSIVRDGTPKAVVFIAHWCAPCLPLVPSVNAWVAEGGVPAGTAVYSVASYNNPQRPNYPASSWLAAEGWQLPLLVDDQFNPVATAFGAPDVPFWVFIDAEGRVAVRGVGEISLDDVAAALQELVEAQ